MAQPKLRFKREDGTNYPDWDKKKIGDLAKIFSAARVHRDEWQTEGVPFWRSSDVMAFHQHKVNPMGKAYITLELYEKLSSKSGKMQKGDILITGGGSIGVPYLIQDDCPLYVKDADLLCIQKSVNHNSGFLYQFFWSPTFRSYLGLISHKGTIAHYTITQIGETPVTIPCLEEQQKIADFLSTIDEVIVQSEVEVQNLEQQKKAAMQKIFSQEVRFRCEDGTAFPEWEEKAITEICESILGGGTPTTENKDYWNGDIAWVSSSDLDNNDIHHLTITRFITEEAIRCSATKRIPCDSVLIVSRVGVGKVVVAPCELCTSQDFTNIVKPKCNSLFLGYMLSIIMQIKANGVQGTSIKGVTAKEIKQYRISIPCLEEQQKIADFLSAYDEVITYAKQELDKWKELKKGLLQQMFV